VERDLCAHLTNSSQWCTIDLVSSFLFSVVHYRSCVQLLVWSFICRLGVLLVLFAGNRKLFSDILSDVLI